MYLAEVQARHAPSQRPQSAQVPAPTFAGGLCGGGDQADGVGVAALGRNLGAALVDALAGHACLEEGAGGRGAGRGRGVLSVWEGITEGHGEGSSKSPT